MPIKFPVGRGTILLCDYSLGGFREPEMVKRRPAIVVSPRLSHRDGLCAVVPLSTKAPIHPNDYVLKLDFERPLPPPFDRPESWAKCDMLATVSFSRLDLFQSKRLSSGKRQYITPKLTAEQLERIQHGILTALGIRLSGA